MRIVRTILPQLATIPTQLTLLTLTNFTFFYFSDNIILWRDVRVVEGGDLESRCGGNSTEGSNPSLSEFIEKFIIFW